VRQPTEISRNPLFAALFAARSQARPLNIIVFVMKSVGAKKLHLSGAPLPDSPAPDELAHHAIVLNNAYVSQPFTSAAMGALFASLYPAHNWLTIPPQSPAIQVPKLPAILAGAGYRTVFIHSGALDYDGQPEFLKTRGFEQLIARAHDDNQPRDAELVPAAMNWIGQQRDRPFFMPFWTQDAHNPYFSNSNRKYVDRMALKRYLNAVAWTDQSAGTLAAAIKRAGLTDNTLIVITDDHGEAFEEHGQSVRNFSFYNEEVRIPLMFVSEKLIPNRIDVNAMARQIDIAPSLLDLLGIAAPAAWQGTSLFAGRPTRAYLFSIAGDFRLGLVESNYVYTRDYSVNRQQLYDIVADPGEVNDLSANPAFNSLMQRDRVRLEAWLDFQNNYLGEYACPSCAVQRQSPIAAQQPAS
jgi:arylsulfatase A-like enzyme